MNKIRQPIKMQRTSNPRLALEPRIVFDAAVAATGAELFDSNSDAATYVPPAANDSLREVFISPVKEAAPELVINNTPEARSDVTEATARVEIIFVDSAVRDIQTYLVGKNAEVVILEAGRDGVDQIAQTLSGRTDISAIHIISHGQAGQLQLGTGLLTTQSVGDRYAQGMAIIKGALTADGDLLVYGCRVGEGVVGQVFVGALAIATGADVEASEDDTGSTK